MTEGATPTPKLDAFEEIPNKSMAANLAAILSCGPEDDVITEEERLRWDRFYMRIMSAGRYVADSWAIKSKLAIEIYQMHEERDYELFENRTVVVEDGKGGHHERFSSWTEFVDVLGPALGISPRTVNNYLKYRKFGFDVMRLDDDAFLSTNGALCVRAAIDMCAGHDGRFLGDYRDNIRPRTQETANTLNALYPDMEFPEQLTAYYHENLAHNLSDPSANNKPPTELAEQVRESMGAPSFVKRRIMERGKQVGVAVTIIYPDRVVGGTEILGGEQTYAMYFKSDFVERAVLDHINDKLGAFHEMRMR